MVEVEVSTRLSDGDRDGVRKLARTVTPTGKPPALDDEQGEGAARSGHDLVVALARAPERDEPLAYAQARRDPRRWELDLLVAPDGHDDRNRDDETTTEPGCRVLAAVLDGIARRGGGRAHLWVSQPTVAQQRAVEAAGLRPARDLWQLRCGLPRPEPWSLATRPFEPGRDEQAWLAVNNRAFDWHPEQGGWTLEDLRRKEQEPWFDAEGFLLHERDGRLAGFCWTKVHARHRPPLGEIYVIAVDPDFSGRGLGRELTLAGLDHLARAGLTVGMLYVDATNTPAVALYRRLGFTRHHVDRSFAVDVRPDGPGRSPTP